jgi:hypothetical protein
MARSVLTELNLNANKITGLAPGSTTGDAVAFEQLAALGGGSVTGVLADDGIVVDSTVPATPAVGVLVDPASDVALSVSATGVLLNPAATGSAFVPVVTNSHVPAVGTATRVTVDPTTQAVDIDPAYDTANTAAVDAKIDDVTILTTSTSMSATKTGTSATGDLTWTLALDSLTLSNTYTGTDDPNTTAPTATPEGGDLYIQTPAGVSYIYDGTTWVQLATAAPGIAAITPGPGIAVDATNPNVPIVSGVVDPASATNLTVSATGFSFATTGLARVFAADVGAGTSVAVAHGLGTTDVKVDVYEIASGATIDCDVVRTDVDTVTLGFAVAVTAGTYRVVVDG